jgi:hypothetical protein
MASRGGQSPASVASHLEGITSPAKQTHIVRHARKQNAEPDVIELLENLPDREYENMADAMNGRGDLAE